MNVITIIKKEYQFEREQDTAEVRGKSHERPWREHREEGSDMFIF